MMLWIRFRQQNYVVLVREKQNSGVNSHIVCLHHRRTQKCLFSSNWLQKGSNAGII